MIQETLLIALDADLLCEMGWETQPPGLSLCPHWWREKKDSIIYMLALLAYSLLERQARQNGLQITTRRIILKLESLGVIETHCWDGSRLCRLVPVDDEQAALLVALQHILEKLVVPRLPHPLLVAGDGVPLALLAARCSDTM